MVTPPACRPQGGQPPRYAAREYFARARALLLNVGIIRPAADMSAAKITACIANDSAPANIGKITDPDRSDVPRFLNR